MTLYEQQSTYNPNMPLRGFFYFSQLYQIHIEKNKLNIHSSKLIKVPEPRFVVFYNGDRNKPDTFRLRLSDATTSRAKSGGWNFTTPLTAPATQIRTRSKSTR